MKMRVAILASGDGSNFEAIVEATRAGRLSAEIVGLLTNRKACGALARAERLQVPTKTFSRAQFDSAAACDKAIHEQLKLWQADWVVLAGYTGLIGASVLAEFPNRVVNSHPSLLPKYGGKGMFGHHVHTAVLTAKERETGITIHLLNERFDDGPVVAQTKVLVDPSDTPATLAERVKSVERVFYPTVLQDLLTGRIK